MHSQTSIEQRIRWIGRTRTPEPDRGQPRNDLRRIPLSTSHAELGLPRGHLELRSEPMVASEKRLVSEGRAVLDAVRAAVDRLPVWVSYGWEMAKPTTSSASLDLATNELPEGIVDLLFVWYPVVALSSADRVRRVSTTQTMR